MIELVDLCYTENSLSRYEFVEPIAAALTGAGADVSISHYSRANISASCTGVVLCGTALKDGSYLEHLDALSWVRSCSVPILGICAGMQAIAALHGGQVVRQPEIGLRNIDIIAQSPLLGAPRTISGYHLHTYAATLPGGFDVLAGSAKYVEAFSSRHAPQYGILFHPEVRNTWILESFAHICGEV